MNNSNFSTFDAWQDFNPVPIVPVPAGEICYAKDCPHITNAHCPFWGVLEWTTLPITADEVWQKKGYCYFYAE